MVRPLQLVVVVQFSSVSVICNGFVDPFVNAEFTNNDNSLMIFPNPVNDILNIRLSETYTESATWEIVSVTGQTIMNGTLNSSNAIIDISSIKTGMYILVVKDNEQNYFRKFNKK
jgi:hypothetical protein